MSPTSVQLRLDLDSVAHDVARFGSGARAHRLAVLDVTGADQSLASADDAQQEELLAGRAQFLNAQLTEFQVLVRAEPVDLSDHLERIHQQALGLPEALAAPGLRLHRLRPHPGPSADAARAPLLRHLARARPGAARGSARASWTACAADSGEPRRSDDALVEADLARQLVARCDQVARDLARSGLQTRRLSGLGYAQLAAPLLGARAGSYPALPTRDRRLHHPGRRRRPSHDRHGAADRSRPSRPRRAPRARARPVSRRAPAGAGRPHPGRPGGAERGARCATTTCGWTASTRACWPSLPTRARSPPAGWRRWSRATCRSSSASTCARWTRRPWCAPSATHVARLQAWRLAALRGERVADPEQDIALEDAERLRAQLQRGDERVFSVSLYVLVRAASPRALDDLTRRVETLLDGMLAHSRRLRWQQESGFRSCLPEGRDRVLVTRNLDTSALAATLPFVGASLSMERGMLYGISARTQSPIIVDPFDDRFDNYHLAVMAPTGSGKSYFVKLDVLRSLLGGTDYLVVDPEDEYRRAGRRDRRADGAAGAVLARSDQPARPGAAGSRTSRRRRRVRWPRRSPPWSAGWSCCCAPAWARTARPACWTWTSGRVLDRALHQTYAAAGITPDTAGDGRPAPPLGALQATLAADRGRAGRPAWRCGWTGTRGPACSPAGPTSHSTARWWSSRSATCPRSSGRWPSTGSAATSGTWPAAGAGRDGCRRRGRHAAGPSLRRRLPGRDRAPRPQALPGPGHHRPEGRRPDRQRARRHHPDQRGHEATAQAALGHHRRRRRPLPPQRRGAALAARRGQRRRPAAGRQPATPDPHPGQPGRAPPDHHQPARAGRARGPAGDRRPDRSKRWPVPGRNGRLRRACGMATPDGAGRR